MLIYLVDYVGFKIQAANITVITRSEQSREVKFVKSSAIDRLSVYFERPNTAMLIFELIHIPKSDISATITDGYKEFAIAWVPS